MPGEEINLANILSRIQFAQDAFAVFQAADEPAKEELNVRKKLRAVQAEQEIHQTDHLEGKTVHKIDEDQQRGRSFDDMLDEARKRLEEHKQSAEADPAKTAGKDAHKVDIII
jgi:hypothetical protein